MAQAFRKVVTGMKQHVGAFEQAELVNHEKVIGAMMFEQNDKRSLDRRCIRLQGLQTVSDTVPTRPSAVARRGTRTSAPSVLQTYSMRWDTTKPIVSPGRCRATLHPASTGKLGSDHPTSPQPNIETPPSHPPFP